MSVKSGPYGHYHTTNTGVRFHLDHYLRVRRARQATLNLPDKKDYYEDQDTGEIPDHELIGTVIVKKETGKKYVIDKVCRQWYCGWYWMVLARQLGTKSHAQIMWENENCRLDFMIDLIDKGDWEVTDEKLSHEETYNY